MNSVDAFLEIVKRGSLSAAAKSLGYSQSNLSHMLMSLEDELGVTLLVRGRGGVRLTREGEALMPYLNDVASANERLGEKAGSLRGITAGKLKVASFSSVACHWLPDIIGRFHEKYPLIEFELAGGSYLQIESLIASKSADCAFIRLPTKTPMKTHLLKKDPFLAILPPGHRYSGSSGLTFEMLAGDPFILPDDIGDNEVLPFFKARGYTPNVVYTVPDIFTVMAMVRAGLGVSVMTNLASSDFEGIVRKPLDSGESRKIGIAIAEKPTAAAKKFVEFTREYIKEQ